MLTPEMSRDLLEWLSGQFVSVSLHDGYPGNGGESSAERLAPEWAITETAFVLGSPLAFIVEAGGRVTHYAIWRPDGSLADWGSLGTDDTYTRAGQFVLQPGDLRVSLRGGK